MIKAKAVIGLLFGDEGKGRIVDFLARKTSGPPLVSRFNGASQAAHTVYDAGRIHIFHQFGSGTFVEETGTFIPSAMLSDPVRLIDEEMALKEIGVRRALSRLLISRGSPVIFPFHLMLGRMLEVSRGVNPFGSVGLGVGQAVLDVKRGDGAGVVFGDLLDKAVLREKLKLLIAEKAGKMEEILRQDLTEEQKTKIEQLRQLFGRGMDADALTDNYANYGYYFRHNLCNDSYLLKTVLGGRPVIFEGAQGTLLDPDWGFSPYVTKTTTICRALSATMANSAAGCDAEEQQRLNELAIDKIGVLRPYGHRHGAGPFVSEEKDPVFNHYLEEPGFYNEWQGKFRLGWLDLPALRYAIALNEGLDYLALTNLDRLTGIDPIKVVSSYLYEGETSLLDKHFSWERLGRQTALITGFLAPDFGKAGRENNPGLSAVLKHCRPHDFIEFPGWSGEISGATNLSDLPAQARELIKFIGSPEGLGLPVKIVSVGPGHENTIEIDQ